MVKMVRECNRSGPFAKSVLMKKPLEATHSSITTSESALKGWPQLSTFSLRDWIGAFWLKAMYGMIK